MSELNQPRRYHLAQLGTLFWALAGPFAILGLLVPAGPEVNWFFVWQWVFGIATAVMFLGRLSEQCSGHLRPIFGGLPSWLKFWRDTGLIFFISLSIWWGLKYLSSSLA